MSKRWPRGPEQKQAVFQKNNVPGWREMLEAPRTTFAISKNVAVACDGINLYRENGDGLHWLRVVSSSSSLLNTVIIKSYHLNTRTLY